MFVEETKKSKSFSMKVTEEQDQELERMAKERGLKKAQLIKTLLDLERQHNLIEKYKA